MDMIPRSKSVAGTACTLMMLAAAFTTLPSSSLQAADNEMKNELRNGDFNLGDASWEMRLRGDVRIGNQKKINVAGIASAGPDGGDSKVLQVNLAAYQQCDITQGFRVPGNIEALNVSFRYKTSSDFNPSKPGIYVEVAGTTSPSPNGHWPRFKPASEEWQVFTTRFLMNAKKEPLVFRISVGGGTGTLLVDDIKVTGEKKP